MAPILFTHGAGASCSSPWMKELQVHLTLAQLNYSYFDFPYMQKSLASGRRRPPDNITKLENYFVDQIEKCDCPVIIGGKSMGGRVATRISNHPLVKKIVCFGFPFFSSNKTISFDRLEELLITSKPVLIFQGTKDPMGSLELISKVQFPNNFQLIWFENANHDLMAKNQSPFKTISEHLKSFISK